MFADKGFIGEDFQKQLMREAGIHLQTLKRKNRDDPRGKNASAWLVSTRRLVETVIGQLTDQFHIEKNWTRDV